MIANDNQIRHPLEPKKAQPEVENRCQLNNREMITLLSPVKEPKKPLLESSVKGHPVEQSVDLDSSFNSHNSETKRMTRSQFSKLKSQENVKGVPITSVGTDDQVVTTKDSTKRKRGRPSKASKTSPNLLNESPPKRSRIEEPEPPLDIVDLDTYFNCPTVEIPEGKESQVNQEYPLDDNLLIRETPVSPSVSRQQGEDYSGYDGGKSGSRESSPLRCIFYRKPCARLMELWNFEDGDTPASPETPIFDRLIERDFQHIEETATDNVPISTGTYRLIRHLFFYQEEQ